MIRRHQDQATGPNSKAIDPPAKSSSFLSRRRGIPDPLQAAVDAAAAVPKLEEPEPTQVIGDSAQQLGTPQDVDAATTDRPDLASHTSDPVAGPSGNSESAADGSASSPDLMKLIPRSGVILAPIASGKTTLAASDSRFRDVDDIRLFPHATPEERETLNRTLYTLGMAGLHDAYDNIWQPMVKAWAKEQPEETILLVHTPRDAVSTGRPLIGALLPDPDDLEVRYAERTGPGWGDQPERMREIARANARGVAEQAASMKLPVFTSAEALLKAVAPAPSSSSPAVGPTDP